MTHTDSAGRPVDTIALRSSDGGCHACGQVFGTLAAFDGHQIVRRRRRPAVTCRAPQDLGLVQDDRGVWRTPQGLAHMKALPGRLRAARQEPGSREGMGSG